MRDFTTGFGYVGKGLRWVAGHGRSWALGLVPALIALVLYAAALAALAYWADDVAVWATPFADDWDSPWPGLLRGLFMALLLLGGIGLALLTFTAVALLIGDPFYEALSGRVEEDAGHCPPSPDEPLLPGLWRSLKESVHVLSRALMFTVPLFFLGFVPFFGQTVVPALGFAVAGFFLTVELTSFALQRRGIDVRGRLALLRRRKMLALGFGVPIVLLFLVPLAAVVVMPGAVVGATLLARHLVGDDVPAAGPAPGPAPVPGAPGTPPAPPAPGAPPGAGPPRVRA
ncbi:EI24 domain-containing protein [Streptomyces aculeolatus]